jgi:hypothetical protein
VATSIALATPGSTKKDKFSFSVPGQLKPDAEVGKPYRYSLCVGIQTKLHCGTLLKDAKNPHGGHSPYRIEKRFAADESIPRNLKLSSNGLLAGTPIPQAVPKVDVPRGGRLYRFTVCAIDDKADFVCRRTSLFVKAAATAPSSVTGTLQERVTERPASDLTFTSTGDGKFTLTIAKDGTVQGAGEIRRAYSYSGACSIQASDSATLTIGGTADLAKKSLSMSFSAPEPPTVTRRCGSYTVSTSSPAFRFPGLGKVTLELKPGATFEDPRNQPCGPSDTCIVRVAIGEIK